MSNTTTVISEGRLWIARDALAGGLGRFRNRPAYRAELFKAARREAPFLTSAELDAGLQAMLAAGNVQARKVNGRTMYHYADFWQRADEEARQAARRALPPVFKPNVRAAGVWFDHAQTRTLAEVSVDGIVHVTLFDEERHYHTGTGPTVREAYRAAWRAQRLARHTVPALLRERAGLRRMYDQALRKVAMDEALKRRLTQENEELRRAAADKGQADDLVAIIAALIAERDALRAEVERLQYLVVDTSKQAIAAWEELDSLKASLVQEEGELLPF